MDWPRTKNTKTETWIAKLQYVETHEYARKVSATRFKQPFPKVFCRHSTSYARVDRKTKPCYGITPHGEPHRPLEDEDSRRRHEEAKAPTGITISVHCTHAVQETSADDGGGGRGRGNRTFTLVYKKYMYTSCVRVTLYRSRRNDDDISPLRSSTNELIAYPNTCYVRHVFARCYYFVFRVVQATSRLLLYTNMSPLWKSVRVIVASPAAAVFVDGTLTRE